MRGALRLFGIMSDWCLSSWWGVTLVDGRLMLPPPVIVGIFGHEIAVVWRRETNSGSVALSNKSVSIFTTAGQ